jgi:stearoyl-CoA desaturase (delta-9 desaturase)
MFAITGFYHRYFAHKAFKTSRPVQFAFAVVGAASVQRGPLWWAAHHRHHHRHADTEHDVHSPRHGFFRSHMGWFLTRRGFGTNFDSIKDIARFPELRLLDRFDILVPALLAAGLYALGSWLESAFPQLGTTGCWCGASSCPRSCFSMPRSPSIRWRTAGARAASPPATTAATTPSWR